MSTHREQSLFERLLIYEAEQEDARLREEDRVKRQVEKARKWLKSLEGKQAMQGSQERAKRTAEKFAEASRVDPEDLHRAVTI